MSPADGTPALEERVLAEYGWVRRLAASLLESGADADDVAQEVVTAALSRRPLVEPGSGIRRWLHRVTRRQASLWRRVDGVAVRSRPRVPVRRRVRRIPPPSSRAWSCTAR